MQRLLHTLMVMCLVLMGRCEMNEKKSLRVLVVFEFDDIETPDCDEACAIVAS